MSGPAGVFLDRDGTLIEDVGYPRDPQAVQLLDSVGPALRRFRALGLQLVVVSNQSGIGRGLVSPAEAAAVHDRFVDLLRDEGVTLDDARYCPHAPEDGCDCRKPAPRMILDAAAALEIDLDHSVVVGDAARDLECGRRAGCRHLIALARARANDVPPDASRARDWREVETLVVELIGGR